MQGMEMQERSDAGDGFDDERDERTQNVGEQDADKSAGKTDERCFGKEDVTYVAFSRAESTQDTNFSSTFDDGVGRDDADHDGGHDKRNCRNRNEHRRNKTENCIDVVQEHCRHVKVAVVRAGGIAIVVDILACRFLLGDVAGENGDVA